MRSATLNEILWARCNSYVENLSIPRQYFSLWDTSRSPARTNPCTATGAIHNVSHPLRSKAIAAPAMRLRRLHVFLPNAIEKAFAAT